MKEIYENLHGNGKLLSSKMIGHQTGSKAETLENILEETEWIRSTSFLNGTTGEINYKKRNGIIKLYGSVLSGGTDRINSAIAFFNLPANFAPDRDTWISGTPAPSSTNFPENNAAVLSVGSNGQVVVQRATTGAVFFRFDVTYFSK